MQNAKPTAMLSIDGYQISATFADSQNTEAVGHVKHILLSAFIASSAQARPGGILAVPSGQRYNNGDRGKPHAP